MEKKEIALKGHQFLQSDRIIDDIYPHSILMYEDKELSNDLWFVELARDGRPYRVSKENSKFKHLKFEDQTPISSEIIEGIKDLILFEQRYHQLEKSDCRAILSKNFVFMQEFGEFMNSIIRGKVNGIVWGPGGHGKSEGVMEILNYAKLMPYSYFKSVGEGLTESAMMGGNDMKALRDNGEIIFNLQKSFTEKQIVIIEEIFDAPISVLTYLKDILTSGYVRNGSQLEPIRCRIVIGLTNRDAKDVAKDNSRKALLERFPHRQELKWDRYSSENYAILLKKAYSKELVSLVGENNSSFYIDSFSNILEAASKGKEKISPRIAKAGMNSIIVSIKNNKVDDRFQHFIPLKFVSGFENVKDEIQERLSASAELSDSKNNIKFLKDSFLSIEERYSKLKNGKLEGQDLLVHLSLLSKDIIELTEITMNASYHDDHIYIFQECKRELDEMKSKLESMITSTVMEITETLVNNKKTKKKEYVNESEKERRGS